MLLLTFPLRCRFEWEQGHQNRTKVFATLSLRSRMNILADELAGEYNSTCGRFIPEAPVLPASPAQLLICGVSITSNYRKMIQRAILEPEYIQYLILRFGWNEFVVDSILWKSLKLAVVRIIRTAVVTKLCNDLLPTSARISKWNMRSCPKCSCGVCDKTFDHIIRCGASSCVKWRTTYLCKLRETMLTYKTNEELVQCFIECIDQWFIHDEVDPAKHPKVFRSAIIEQNRIG